MRTGLHGRQQARRGRAHPRQQRTRARDAQRGALRRAAGAAGGPGARRARCESDAFWQALKEKDAQIEELKADLARAEAEPPGAGRPVRAPAALRRSGRAARPGPGARLSLTGDSSEPG